MSLIDTTANLSAWNASTGTASPRCDINWKVIDTFCFIIFVVASAASLVGNSLIIVTILKFQGLRTVTNFFIVNMCASDISVPLVQLLWDTLFLRHPEVLLDKDSLGTALCIVFHFTFNVSATVSIQSLILIAVDRFYAIVLPTRARLQGRRICILLLITTWVVGLAISLPQAVHTTFYIYNDEGVIVGCYSKGWTKDDLFALQLFVLLLFRAIPLVVISILYAVMIVKLKQQKIPGNPSHAQSERRRMQNLRRVKMMLTVVVGFFCGWTLMPIFEFVQTRVKGNQDVLCSFTTAVNVMIVLPSIHTALNPWIYFVYSKNFRQGFSRLLSRGIHRSSRVGANRRNQADCSQQGNVETSFRMESVSKTHTQFESDMSSTLSTAANLWNL